VLKSPVLMCQLRQITTGRSAFAAGTAFHAPNPSFPALRNLYCGASLQPGSASMMTDGPGVRMMWVRRRPAAARQTG
jgi:hypothetical protein